MALFHNAIKVNFTQKKFVGPEIKSNQISVGTNRITFKIFLFLVLSSIEQFESRKQQKIEIFPRKP